MSGENSRSIEYNITAAAADVLLFHKHLVGGSMTGKQECKSFTDMLLNKIKAVTAKLLV